MSNTFFISPLIPLRFYIAIQKEKNNPNIPFNNQEIKFIRNINQLFDYSIQFSSENKQIVSSIIEKISNNVSNYSELTDKLTFVNQNTFQEITNYNYVYYDLLKQRNYDQIVNPFQVKNIDMCVGLSDTGPLVDLDTSTFKNLKTDKDKFEYINKIIDDKKDNIKYITHDIMAKSNVDSKINTITKILSNKSVLYYILKGEDFIPISETLEVTNEDNVLDTIINKFKQSIQSDYFVIKPAEGTLSDGVGIFNKNLLDLNFIKTWLRNPDNNKYAITGQYSSWILSEFIQSFLWKLTGQNITSQIFPQLANKEPNLRFNFNDQIGRINKFRFWALYTIIDGEFTSYLYKNGYCEISLEELTNYSKTQLDPANIETFYQNLLDVEEDSDILQKVVNNPNGPENDQEEKVEASFIGTYLDFARVVNAGNYPMGANVWNNELMPRMYSLVNSLSSKMKRFMNCMNKYKIQGSKCCYSFFALDIIIDSNSKPWLLETNSRPFVGFGNYFNKYDPNNDYVLNVNHVFDTVLGLTTDVVNGTAPKGVRYEDFLVTNVDKIHNRHKIYVPYSLGITPTATSRVYNEIYSILDDNNYSAFPYPREMSERRLNKAIGFRGMSPIGKFLISKISEIGKDKFISLMRELFPYDAKMKVLNRINTLAFYLGDKAEMTKILKTKVKNWDSIIPYSDTVNLSNVDNNQVLNLIQNSALNQGKIIAKPAYGQQGKGIIISDNVQNLVNQMRQDYNETGEDEYVLSKYLDNPYLIKLNKQGVSGVNYDDQYGRKAHLRAYVLVHKKQKTLNVYLYKESLIFCAAKEYNDCNNDPDKSFCNLTNLYFGSKYYKEVLNKNPGDAYKDLSGLAHTLVPPENYNQLMNRIKYICKTVVFSVKDDLMCINDTNDCYQYIALDFHLENKENSAVPVPVPWLLEVNATPGLKSPDYQWQNIGGLHNFLESILNITVDTKMSKEGNQLFEYLPHKQKRKPNYVIELPFRKQCMSYSYIELKRILSELQYSGRSSLNTKNKMCNAINKIK